MSHSMSNVGQREQKAQDRVVGLFRLTFRDASVMLDKVKGEPAYLILAMNSDKLKCSWPCVPRNAC